jgi:hypothetical protein
LFPHRELAQADLLADHQQRLLGVVEHERGRAVAR